MTVQYRLFQKTNEEYNTFINELKRLPIEQAIEKSYEKVIKEDMVACLEFCELTNKEAKSLLKLKKPLESMYQEWLNKDCSYMDMLRDTIDDLAQSEIKRRHKRDYER